ncbi:MAG: helix-turn-helix transcriptional regulator [Rickettsiaceae bacterium]|nr:helix-turn-helix transcriptional regulator [Rickettsiaceae bacterium]
MSSFQMKLSELMTQKNITAPEIERKTGLSKNTITSILNGTSLNPTANTLKAIARGLDVSLDYFLSFDTELTYKSLTKDQMSAWSQSTSHTINMIIERDLSFTFEKLQEIIREVYNYAIRVEPPIVDSRFIQYILDRHSK